MRKFWLKYRWLILIILLAFVVRLYKIDNPVADWHSFRQADTASVTREYVKHGINLLEPHYQDVSNIQSGQDNLDGYRMVEFPMLNAGIAAVVILTGAPLEITSRLVSILFSLITLVSLFFLVQSTSGKRLAYLTVVVYSLLPYGIYYSRVIMPEPAMLAFATFSLAAFMKWIKSSNWRWAVAAWVGLVLALLLKPFVLFLAPVYLVIAWQKYRWQIWKHWELIIFAATSVVPLYAWREWITQFPSGIPVSDWLFNSNGIRLRPAWFRWLGWERLTKLWLGYVGIMLLPFNLIRLQPDLLLYGSWWLGILAYFIVIATGNVQHDYYQILAIPIVCISVARGAMILFDVLKKKMLDRLAAGLIGVILVVSLVLAWQQVKGYFSVNHWEYVEAGEAVNRLTPPDALIIAPAMGDTHFLYQTNRRGWPIGFEIEDKVQKGADYYVTTSNDDEARELAEKYTVIEEGSRYIIIDLHQLK